MLLITNLLLFMLINMDTIACPIGDEFLVSQCSSYGRVSDILSYTICSYLIDVSQEKHMGIASQRSSNVHLDLFKCFRSDPQIAVANCNCFNRVEPF